MLNVKSGYESWGRYPRVEHKHVEPVFWRSAPPDLRAFEAPVLAYGRGRSYGDVCLNEDGVLLDTAPLRRFMAFDREQGVLRCEAGVTFDQILELIVPHGWFLPVTPGTKHVSVGGAIANDVHGKNHHVDGTFGCYVNRFELLRSSGDCAVCSPVQNCRLFEATIGGLGLTGLILWAEFRLKRIPGSSIEMEQLRFSSLAEFFALSAASNKTHEYAVAWIDALARGGRLGRGVFVRGNFAPGQGPIRTSRTRLRVPFDAPPALLNRLTMKLFNALYYRAHTSKAPKMVHYESFFYPLDALLDWNRLYGRRGFLQHQCVLPLDNGDTALRDMLARVARSGRASFLAVLKTFGDVPSPGLLSFPRPGVTLALDFPYHPETLDLLDALDKVVRKTGGAIYPAKDARMSAESFQMCFPQWQQFARRVDPAFSSSFWRRVTR